MKMCNEHNQPTYLNCVMTSDGTFFPYSWETKEEDRQRLIDAGYTNYIHVYAGDTYDYLMDSLTENAEG